jgi:glycogen operon protein
MYLAGAALGEDDQQGRPIQDDDFILLINSHHEDIPFLLSAGSDSGRWSVLVDTNSISPNGHSFQDGDNFQLAARSLALLIRQSAAAPPALRPSFQQITTAANHGPADAISAETTREPRLNANK